MRVPKTRSNLSIFWISVLGLYLELLLIRWISTEIRIFAYLQNTVLVVCYLGLGIGLFTLRRPISATRGLLSLLILAVPSHYRLRETSSGRSAIYSAFWAKSTSGSEAIWIAR